MLKDDKFNSFSVNFGMKKAKIIFLSDVTMTILINSKKMKTSGKRLIYLIKY
jgi:hypothetical protein